MYLVHRVKVCKLKVEETTQYLRAVWNIFLIWSLPGPIKSVQQASTVFGHALLYE